MRTEEAKDKNEDQPSPEDSTCDCRTCPVHKSWMSGLDLTEENKKVLALSLRALEQIEFNYEQRKLFGPWELKRLAYTIRVQHEAIKELLSYFRRDPLRLVATADTVRVSTLDDIAERCGLPSNPRKRRPED